MQIQTISVTYSHFISHTTFFHFYIDQTVPSEFSLNSQNPNPAWNAYVMHSNLEIPVPYAQTHFQSWIRNHMKALLVEKKKKTLWK